MSTRTLDTDILIVGAGPVGLFLANECARRGLKWRIVESKPAQSEHSKALAIFPRTLEIFDMAGIATPFLEIANRVTSVRIITHEHTLAQMPFQPEESPYPFIAMVPQNVTENILVGELNKKNGHVDYATRFVSATQYDDHVKVVLEKNSHEESIHVAYVVGCDGAHSSVRHQLNLDFEGGEYHDLFMLADIETNAILPAEELQLCPHEAGPLAIFPLNSNRHRVVATVPKAEGHEPALEFVQDLLKDRGPSGLKANYLYWSSYFHIHHRQVAQLRQGRIFLAGDAAHIHSPIGGQGMNTGLHDVWNLVWKLDLHLQGHGNDFLLDSYSTERRPVIKHVVEITDFLTRMMATPNRFIQALRNTVIPMVSRLAPFQHAFVQKMSELGIAYQGSPVVEGSGLRYMDDSLRGGKGICSQYLLLLNRDLPPVMEKAAQQLEKEFQQIIALRRTHDQGIKLVRPDGYIAFSTNRESQASTVETIKSILQQQTMPSV
ncbi:MAG: FAD-dependent monooxygenase [Desulfuromonadales bacterium]|nr:FAD-dependent monooxygenase [Desulfuromonadales bacterium]MBN2792222.1 FAD-dependent monooxygenase [Desulfuromonadales bacterium]